MGLQSQQTLIHLLLLKIKTSKNVIMKVSNRTVVLVILLIFALAIIFFIILVNLIDSPSNGSSTSSVSTRNSPYKVPSETIQTKEYSPSMNQPSQPKTITAGLELFHIYQDIETPVFNEKYYAIKSTDFKIATPIIKIFDQDHRQIGIMNLQDSSLHANKLNDYSAYFVSIKYASEYKIIIDLHLDQLAVRPVQQFEFNEISKLPSEQLRKSWTLNLPVHTSNIIEQAELAYLGPNWQPSEQICARCQSSKYQIEAQDVPITIQNQKKSIHNISTCLTCEIIEDEQYFWQAVSETEYNARTQYLSTKC